jgi:Amt family ammonium transporter
VLIGVFILWLGWLIHNAGNNYNLVETSAILDKSEIALANTFLAPSVCCIVCFLYKGKISGKKELKEFDVPALANGIIAGLVSVSASCDSIKLWASIIVGLIGGLLYCFGCRILQKFRIDDPLEVFAVHFMCGAWGVMAYALFSIEDGVFYGGDPIIIWK